jgi:hypothetical protein
MADPVLLTASYQTQQHVNAYGAVVWTALKNPPASGVTAYNSSVTKARAKGVVRASSRPTYINVSRHGDWLRDFYDRASIRRTS